MTDIENPYASLVGQAGDLCAFMLVCQYGKLSEAAAQMRISQPSMSLRIRNLESSLDTRLFVRHSSGVSLSTEGERLYALLQIPMSKVAQGMQEFRAQTQLKRVVISVDHAFASFWLLPRLPLLREKLGDTDIRIHSSQDPLSIADADIAIFMAKPEYKADSANLLFKELVSAVCSPDLESDAESTMSVEDLINSGVPLLHLKAPGLVSAWVDWAQWLPSAGLNPELTAASLEFNSYEMVLKAAKSGQGLALGWHHLIDEQLARGELLELTPGRMETGNGYYVQQVDQRAGDIASVVQEWIVNQARGKAEKR